MVILSSKSGGYLYRPSPTQKSGGGGVCRGGECIIPPGFTPVTSGNELNTCNGIFKTGSNYKYKYDSDQFQTEY